MKKKYYLLLLLLAIPPVLLAYLLHCNVLLGIEIAGKESDWVTFWGNYSGGIFSGVISFYILYKTLVHNHNENEKILYQNRIENDIQRRYEHIQLMRRDLAERFSKLNFQNIAGAGDCKDKFVNWENEITRLGRFNITVQNDYNSFLMLYDGELPQTTEQYVKVVNQLSNDIITLINMYYDYKSFYNEYDKADKLSEIRDFCLNLNKNTRMVTQLWKIASSEINNLDEN